MEQLEFFKVLSPCIGVCSVDDKGYCQGCMRKREERFNWLSMNAAQQLYVIKLCQQRYKRKKQKQQAQNQADSDPETNPQRDLF
ncbi:DUF1289 domain-containing protein [Vibrio qinghaiensis]|uniref:DUF1289 domain-containing protein n=1 Tax=Vibrio qinghaiensis TaxID=2025808 RepID=A0A223MXD9_9VIBR|nr:DUF1289 domain-containing protein [Vibrio qinghaiensis]ASU22143.1 DUF1289 domain-containing protein [Vibrio qinghaiensis]